MVTAIECRVVAVIAVRHYRTSDGKYTCLQEFFWMKTASAGVLCAASLMCACAAVVTADGQRLEPASAEFRAYVERVFREQNEVASELAFAIEDAAPDPPAALTSAEDALIGACAGLNEIAARRRDEQRAGARRGLAAARAAPQCERAARAARAALAAAQRG
jgi:hypothetical protein